ncbi:MAG: DUF5615 family PIN-like protein [Alphaproteobacteria bacterium]|nr:DUF5615 family PIN-like protein [Alphaproteobacteria bacterium]
MRILADSNVQKSTVVALRLDGHDVAWVMERESDPGDRAILEEAFRSRRVLVTVDKGFGRLVVAERRSHAGLVLLDETKRPGAQAEIVRGCIEKFEADLVSGAFFRVSADGRARRQRRRT